MGWVWKDDEPDELDSFAAGVIPGGNCSIRKAVKLKCRTEEVEPGKFIRKCEKTEQLLRDCIGKPVEVVASNKEYTEDDVTAKVRKGPGSSEMSEHEAYDFPGLRSDLEALTHSFLNGINRFFEEAEEMKNGFFNVFGAPRVFDGESSSPPSTRRGMPGEGHSRKDSFPKTTEPDSGHFDLSGLAKDV
ncbi:hypothetical protein I3843_09G023400 [Carya illinoinensis]|uniref:Mal d 1-associated protein n=1 Tax=Carya illinoinensis TaxID=32201 RepID=A0A8T1PF87_CARIL|nr:fra a 1-associated protein-like [Carya illinoinensis]KAG6640708.1 hypothetical protein CIPAW_09G023100 [Carya illinoinensis]KAG6693872.1 hypothetical protein I3842_09G023200 [Carya illinoinensis]KAG7961561.1 hypothetical protein I3843_09G023400 [Carya illinoinensis]